MRLVNYFLKGKYYGNANLGINIFQAPNKIGATSSTYIGTAYAQVHICIYSPLCTENLYRHRNLCLTK